MTHVLTRHVRQRSLHNCVDPGHWLGSRNTRPSASLHCLNEWIVPRSQARLLESSGNAVCAWRPDAAMSRRFSVYTSGFVWHLFECFCFKRAQMDMWRKVLLGRCAWYTPLSVAIGVRTSLDSSGTISRRPTPRNHHSP